MHKILAARNIDFADSEYQSFHMDEEATLTIYLQSWDAKVLRIVFSHAVFFLYKLGSIPSNLYEVFDHPLFEQELREAYGNVPTKYAFKFFQIEDIDDFPFIQIIAESVNVFKEDSEIQPLANNF